VFLAQPSSIAGRCPAEQQSPPAARGTRVSKLGGSLLGSWATAACALLIVLGAACNRSDASATPPAPVAQGEYVEYSGVGLSVNSATLNEQIGDFFKPAPGNVFITVNVTISNKRPYQVPYQPYHFTIKDAAGTEYQAGVTAGPQVLQSSTLDATKDVQGNINFEVPRSATGLNLIYKVPGTTGAITVRLGDAASIPPPAPTAVPTPTSPPSTPVPTVTLTAAP
jgi:hypothetical protein